MYQLLRARYRLNRQTGRFKEADVSREPVTTLTQYFGEVILYITYPNQANKTFALRFDKVAQQVSELIPQTTVQEWLSGIGNQTLPFEDDLPNETPRYVYYGPAVNAGYSFRAKARFGHVDDTNSNFQKQDLVLTHPSRSYKDVYENCLASVNGFYHYIDYDDTGVHVYDGNATVRRSNRVDVGLTTFEKVGKIKCVPITPDMIFAQREGYPLYDGCYIKLPVSYDLTNKTVLMVMGGYLHVYGHAYVPIGSNAFRIYLGAGMLLDRYFESLKHLDLSSMGLEIDEGNVSLTSMAQFKSDESVLAYLTLSQSFFVIVDTPSLFHEFQPLESLRAPGRYMGREKLYYPVVGTYGRQLEYHIITQQGRYVYATTRSIANNYDANTRNWTVSGVVDSGRYPAHPYKEGAAHLRVMGTEA